MVPECGLGFVASYRDDPRLVREGQLSLLEEPGAPSAPSAKARGLDSLATVSVGVERDYVSFSYVSFLYVSLGGTVVPD